ncbi:MAG: HAMP domain-containing protein, partial [Anaerolineae bacterium]|nr:HAMP domain-containing protein [Anaerolineae bacterium]
MQALVRRLYPGIGTRVTAPFLLATVVVAGIGVFIVTRLVAGSIQERLNNKLVDSANAATNTVVEVERQHISILRAMVFTEGIDTAIEERDLERIDRLLRPVTVNSAVDDVIIFDAHGQGIFQITRSSLSFALEYQLSEPGDLTERTGVIRVIKGEVDALGDKYVDIVNGENGYIFYFNAPVLNEDGVLVGGISVGITTNKLIRQMSEQALSSLSLYLPEGAILDTTFRTVPQAELQLTTEEALEINGKVRRTNPTEERILNQVTYQVLYVPLEIRSQQIGILAVALPKNFIADRIGTSRNALAMLFSTLFVGIAVMGLMVSRSISNPVKQLVSTTRAIREGDLSKRVGLETPDELGELSVSFDHMTEQLVESNEQIKRMY